MGAGFAAGFVVGLTVVFAMGSVFAAGFVVDVSAAVAAEFVGLCDVVSVGSGVAMGALAGAAVGPIPVGESGVAANAPGMSIAVGLFAGVSNVVGRLGIVAGKVAGIFGNFLVETARGKIVVKTAGLYHHNSLGEDDS